MTTEQKKLGVASLLCVACNGSSENLLRNPLEQADTKLNTNWLMNTNKTTRIDNKEDRIQIPTKIDNPVATNNEETDTKELQKEESKPNHAVLEDCNRRDHPFGGEFKGDEFRNVKGEEVSLSLKDQSFFEVKDDSSRPIKQGTYDIAQDLPLTIIELSSEVIEGEHRQNPEILGIELTNSKESEDVEKIRSLNVPQELKSSKHSCEVLRNVDTQKIERDESKDEVRRACDNPVRIRTEDEIKTLKSNDQVKTITADEISLKFEAEDKVKAEIKSLEVRIEDTIKTDDEVTSFKNIQPRFKIAVDDEVKPIIIAPVVKNGSTFNTKDNETTENTTSSLKKVNARMNLSGINVSIEDNDSVDDKPNGVRTVKTTGDIVDVKVSEERSNCIEDKPNAVTTLQIRGDTVAVKDIEESNSSIKDKPNFVGTVDTIGHIVGVNSIEDKPNATRTFKTVGDIAEVKVIEDKHKNKDLSKSSLTFEDMETADEKTQTEPNTMLKTIGNVVCDKGEESYCRCNQSNRLAATLEEISGNCTKLPDKTINGGQVGSDRTLGYPKKENIDGTILNAYPEYPKNGNAKGEDVNQFLEGGKPGEKIHSHYENCPYATVSQQTKRNANHRTFLDASMNVTLNNNPQVHPAMFVDDRSSLAAEMLKITDSKGVQGHTSVSVNDCVSPPQKMFISGRSSQVERSQSVVPRRLKLNYLEGEATEGCEVVTLERLQSIEGVCCGREGTTMFGIGKDARIEGVEENRRKALNDEELLMAQRKNDIFEAGDGKPLDEAFKPSRQVQHCNETEATKEGNICTTQKNQGDTHIFTTMPENVKLGEITEGVKNTTALADSSRMRGVDNQSNTTRPKVPVTSDDIRVSSPGTHAASENVKTSAGDSSSGATHDITDSRCSLHLASEDMKNFARLKTANTDIADSVQFTPEGTKSPASVTYSNSDSTGGCFSTQCAAQEMKNSFDVRDSGSSTNLGLEEVKTSASVTDSSTGKVINSNCSKNSTGEEIKSSADQSLSVTDDVTIDSSSSILFATEELMRKQEQSATEDVTPTCSKTQCVIEERENSGDHTDLSSIAEEINSFANTDSCSRVTGGVTYSQSATHLSPNEFMNFAGITDSNLSENISVTDSRSNAHFTPEELKNPTGVTDPLSNTHITPEVLRNSSGVTDVGLSATDSDADSHFTDETLRNAACARESSLNITEDVTDYLSNAAVTDEEPKNPAGVTDSSLNKMIDVTDSHSYTYPTRGLLKTSTDIEESRRSATVSVTDSSSNKQFVPQEINAGVKDSSLNITVDVTDSHACTYPTHEVMKNSAYIEDQGRSVSDCVTDSCSNITFTPQDNGVTYSGSNAIDAVTDIYQFASQEVKNCASVTDSMPKVPDYKHIDPEVMNKVTNATNDVTESRSNMHFTPEEMKNYDCVTDSGLNNTCDLTGTGSNRHIPLEEMKNISAAIDLRSYVGNSVTDSRSNGQEIKKLTSNSTASRDIDDVDTSARVVPKEMKNSANVTDSSFTETNGVTDVRLYALCAPEDLQNSTSLSATNDVTDSRSRTHFSPEETKYSDVTDNRSNTLHALQGLTGSDVTDSMGGVTDPPTRTHVPQYIGAHITREDMKIAMPNYKDPLENSVGFETQQPTYHPHQRVVDGRSNPFKTEGMKTATDSRSMKQIPSLEDLNRMEEMEVRNYLEKKTQNMMLKTPTVAPCNANLNNINPCAGKLYELNKSVMKEMVQTTSEELSISPKNTDSYETKENLTSTADERRLSRAQEVGKEDVLQDLSTKKLPMNSIDVTDSCDVQESVDSMMHLDTNRLESIQKEEETLKIPLNIYGIIPNADATINLQTKSLSVCKNTSPVCNNEKKMHDCNNTPSVSSDELKMASTTGGLLAYNNALPISSDEMKMASPTGSLPDSIGEMASLACKNTSPVEMAMASTDVTDFCSFAQTLDPKYNLTGLGNLEDLNMNHLDTTERKSETETDCTGQTTNHADPCTKRKPKLTLPLKPQISSFSNQIAQRQQTNCNLHGISNTTQTYDINENKINFLKHAEELDLQEHAEELADLTIKPEEIRIITENLEYHAVNTLSPECHCGDVNFESNNHEVVDKKGLEFQKSEEPLKLPAVQTQREFCTNKDTLCAEEDERRVRRCSSLKTGKTPPGTPGRKKIVRFADVLGLDLADVRTFLDEIPKIPSSAYSDLTAEADFPVYGNQSLKNQRVLLGMFRQPGGQTSFLEKVTINQVMLENAVVEDPISFSIRGLVRVRNLNFDKQVHVRYSLDSWKTFSDLQAVYVDNSCDGFTDKFTFLLYAYSLSIGQKIEFAIRFQSKGVQYWDNNFGANYSFQCLPASNPTTYSPISTGVDDQIATFYYMEATKAQIRELKGTELTSTAVQEYITRSLQKNRLQTSQITKGELYAALIVLFLSIIFLYIKMR